MVDGQTTISRKSFLPALSLGKQCDEHVTTRPGKHVGVVIVSFKKWY